MIRWRYLHWPPSPGVEHVLTSGVPHSDYLLLFHCRRQPKRRYFFNVNDYAGCPVVRGVGGFFASKLAPTVLGDRMSCAAFSAIISVGEQVLPEVMRGMIDASAMRRPGMPVYAQLAVDHRVLVIAHAAGAHRMENRGADPCGGFVQLFFSLQVLAGQVFHRFELAQGRRRRRCAGSGEWRRRRRVSLRGG